MTSDEILQLLTNEVKITMGCTDPAAIALATAYAQSIVPRDVYQIRILISPDLYKNAKSVTIPGTGVAGIRMAVFLGMSIITPKMDLTIFSTLRSEDIQKARDLDGQVKLEVVVEYNLPNIYVEVEMISSQGCGKSIIAYRHDNLVFLQKDDLVILDTRKEMVQAIESFQGYNLTLLIENIQQIQASSLYFLLDGMEANYKMAKEGLRLNAGLKIGQCFQKIRQNNCLNNDLAYDIAAYTAAACDARMSGAMLPVMSSAGSGNQGLVATIPIALAANSLHVKQETTVYALAISHLVTAYVKESIGRLSPICGCGVAAGAGSAAGLTYLLDGNIGEIICAIHIVISTLAGMICDGAKVGCSLKLLVSSSMSWQAALLAHEGLKLPASGIVGATLEQTLNNLKELNKEGMSQVNKVIITCSDH